MKGLLLKDLLNLRRYSRSIFIIVALYALMMFSITDISFIGGMIVLMLTMMSVTSFSYDDMAKWDGYALTLPLTRRDIVRGKYVLALMLAVLGTVISLAAGFVYSLIRHTGILEQLVVAYALFAVALLFVSILFPLIYRFGVEKSRILIIAVVAAPTAALMVLAKSGVSMPGPGALLPLAYLSPVLIAVIFFLSYRISLGLFARKEF